jgi:uncharacterized protein (TIGR02588 family)
VAERITFLISLAILLGLLGLLVFQLLAEDDQPPSIQVTLLRESAYRAAEMYYLPVEIANLGDQTAQNLEIVLSLESEDGQAEAASFAIPFLPGQDSIRGTAVFDQDPSTGEISIDISFTEP